jgi:hypothetical protein
MRPLTFTAVSVPHDHDDVIRSAAGKVRHGCPHAGDRPALFVCVRHPNTVRCHPCAMRHGEAHTDAEEYLCDVCGEDIDGTDSDTTHTALLHPATIRRTVTLGRGRSAYVETALLIGWGTCWSCHVDGQWQGVAS